MNYPKSYNFKVLLNYQVYFFGRSVRMRNKQKIWRRNEVTQKRYFYDYERKELAEIIDFMHVLMRIKKIEFVFDNSQFFHVWNICNCL